MELQKIQFIERLEVCRERLLYQLILRDRYFVVVWKLFKETVVFACLDLKTI